MRTAFLCLLALPLLAACGPALPAPASYVHPISAADVGYSKLQHDMATAALLGFDSATTSDIQAKLSNLADNVASANRYAAALQSKESTIGSWDTFYGWANSVVAGVGSAGAAIDKKRNWGPTAGAIGAVWDLVGLSVDKFFVAPKVSKGADVTTQLAVESKLLTDVDDKWSTLVSASSAAKANALTEWQKSVATAKAGLTSLFGTVGFQIK